jgi:hypothetical protein
LEDFAEAFDVMASGRSGKILLVPNDADAETVDG